MRKLVLLLALGALGLAACGGGESSNESESAPATSSEPTTAPTPAEPAPAAPAEPPAPDTEGEPAVPPPGAIGPDCTVENLALKKEGVLTVATGNPAYSPWFEGGTKNKQWKINDPSTGKGFESAVVYALAERLGFSPEQVAWIPVGFNQSIAPGKKKFDFVLQQISFSKKRAKAVALSDGYYDLNQALVSVKGSKIEGAKSFADLKKAKLGVPVGSTNYDYVVENIKPDAEPRVYDDLNGAVQALKNGQVDGIVTDLPTAFIVRDAQLDKGVIVGQFPTVGETEHLSLAFEKGSKLVSCMNQAIAALKADGTLADIQQQWLSDKASAPLISS